MNLLNPNTGGPPRVQGDATRIQVAEVVTVNADGTIDAKLLTSRAMKPGLRVPTWWVPLVGERCLIADRDGDPQSPICLGFYAPKDGSLSPPLTRYLMGPWTAIPYDASGIWADGAGSAPLQYRTDGESVQLRGTPTVQAAQTGTLPSTIATIPKPPPYAVIVPARALDNGGIGNTSLRLIVTTAGLIRVDADLTGRAWVGAAASVVNLPSLAYSLTP